MNLDMNRSYCDLNDIKVSHGAWYINLYDKKSVVTTVGLILKLTRCLQIITIRIINKASKVIIIIMLFLYFVSFAKVLEIDKILHSVQWYLLVGVTVISAKVLSFKLIC